ncbi:MAG TPA: hypothetical protein VF762_09265 [Blastocatellia bacterium]|jgi:hypothetical protein
MVVSNAKPRRRFNRNQRFKLLLIVTIFVLCFSLLVPTPNNPAVNLQNVCLADIVPSPPAPNVTVLGPSPRSRLGGSGQPDNLSDSNHSQTIAVGDFNADGIQDLAISAPDAELIVGSTIRKAGAVYVIFGRRDLPSVIDTSKAQPGGAEVTILGVNDGDRFGFAIAAADVNGDGVADLIVGAPQVSSTTLQAVGAVYVLFGSPIFGGNAVIDLTQQPAGLVIHGAGDRFGAAIDVGDAGGPVATGHIADLLIGAPGTSFDSNGSAYLVFGHAELGKSIREIEIARSADFTITGGTRNRLGASVAVGDFNGDGVGDLFAGAPGADRPFRSDPAGSSIVPASSTGAVFGLLSPFAGGGSISVDNTAQFLSFYGADSNHRFGQTIAVGDITGDAIADLVIGAPEANGEWKDPGTGIVYNMSAHAGAAYVFAGARGFSPQRIDLATGGQLTAYVGLGSAWTGFALSIGSYNVEGNADLIADLIIGAAGGVRDTARNIGGGGSVRVLFGGHTLSSATTRPRSPFNPAPDPEEVAVFSFPLPVNNDFGFAVAAGDINGDGSGDLIVAAPFVEAAGRAQAGQVQIRYGTTKPPGGGGGDPTPTPIVRLITPAGGEQFTAGKQAVITWSATAIEKVRSFDVLLSTDGGVSFPTSIASSLPSTQTTFSWAVPGTCLNNARIEVVATTSTGEKVKSAPGGSFAIALPGPELDLGKSSVGTGSMSLSAGSGSLFTDDVIVEISDDEAENGFASFSKSPKIKGGGRKLKTRGTIGGRSLADFFPDGATRIIRLTVAPCSTTSLRVMRSGDQLVAADTLGALNSR